ncbi:MAG: 1-deoxy-D-xylulose-5-phosphate synthase [Erysipelotrichia bacterium]|nr:1-deoxy-D-xylulose-5-phosphate synthase [Erysipelotrichia bacterium]
MILEKIKSAADLKKIEEQDLPILCQEIRERLLNVVSKTGGHLASNLGIVELTVILDRLFSPEKDRIVFDVGHQCYVHKILTGRNDQMDSLRQLDGLSGFPKPEESICDSFIAGHASNSISVVLGMARARTLKKENYNVVAIIGDGALTGGLAYEGLTNAAQSKEKMIVILNDNEMSISKNVGGVASFLSLIRTRNTYHNFKKIFRDTLGKIRFISNFVHDFKEKTKKALLDDNIFVDMGFDYIGPVDGHNLQALNDAITYAKMLNHPVLIHVITKKGKGYQPAEKNPSLYHGVGKFSIIDGRIKTAQCESYSDHFGKTLSSIADKNSNVVAITAAMSDGTGLNVFRKRHPKRFFDVGIAEGNAVTMAAGMAKQGLIPVVAIYASFLQRSYDMLIHDVSLQSLHVVIGDDHCGLVGQDGETHNGSFDVSYFNSVPNTIVYSPSSFAELDYMLNKAIDQKDKLVVVRYPKGSQRDYQGCSIVDTDVVSRGDDLTLVSYGDLFNESLKAEELLRLKNISVENIKINTVKPLNVTPILDSVRKTGCLLVVEDVCEADCVGKQILAQLSGKLLFRYALYNLHDGIVKQGSVSQLYAKYQLDAHSIVDNALKLKGINYDGS